MSLYGVLALKSGTSFNTNQIFYRIQKLCNDTKGKAQEDEYSFVKLGEEEKKKNGPYFVYEVNERNEFDKWSFFSNRSPENTFCKFDEDVKYFFEPNAVPRL